MQCAAGPPHSPDACLLHPPVVEAQLTTFNGIDESTRFQLIPLAHD